MPRFRHSHSLVDIFAALIITCALMGAAITLGASSSDAQVRGKIPIGHLRGYALQIVQEDFAARRPMMYCMPLVISAVTFVEDAIQPNSVFLGVDSLVRADSVRIDSVMVPRPNGQGHIVVRHESSVCPKNSIPKGHLHFAGCGPSERDYLELLLDRDEWRFIYCGAPRFYWGFEAEAATAQLRPKRRASARVAPGRSDLPYDPRRDIFAGILGAGLVANSIWRIDVDVGGYKRPNWDRSTISHVGAGALLESFGHSFKVSAPWRVGLVCATSVLFEFTQGYPDPADAGAGCAGALFSAGLRRLLQ